jgi:CHAT domain-containing protein
LRSRESQHRRLLAELEHDHYSLYQMLELKPLDLAAVSEKLPEGEAVVQYLPLDDKLLIHLVTNERIEIREVEVPGEELQDRAALVARALRQGARDIRGLGAAPTGLVQLSDDELHTELAWLYDQLLRPVEHHLAGYDHVYVVAVGALTYVPYAALVQSTEPTMEYAVERFAFGYLPSMYLLHLVLEHVYSINDAALVMGDPDGSLPGARAEAQAVHEMLGSEIPVQLGQGASYDNLLRYLAEARVVHLATHGDLNDQAPERSTILLADDYRLTAVDVMGLPLEEADLIVLSACETGMGAGGQEYATLARAFAHAGAPSLLATLWLVNDEASRRLMERFYEELQDGRSTFRALAEAQRAMLRGAEAYRTPSAWSGYIPLGKPVSLDLLR